MIFIDKRKINRSDKYHKKIVEYKGDDGVWYPVSEIHKMIPLNVEGDMLGLPSLHNRLNIRPFDNPDILLPKRTTAERTSARGAGANPNSKLSKLSNKSRFKKVDKIKLGAFETGELE